MDAELEFAIQPSTTGKQLFDQVSALLCSVFPARWNDGSSLRFAVASPGSIPSTSRTKGFKDDFH